MNKDIADGLVIHRSKISSSIFNSLSNYTNRPRWNSVKCELTFGLKRIRKVARRAHNCIAVLDAFEEHGWPYRIIDPLPDGKHAERLNNTIRTLNKGTCAITFQAGGDGASILWERKEVTEN
jgi:hypothetical protein